MADNSRNTKTVLLIISCLLTTSQFAAAVTINVDYRYDIATTDYFSNPANACQKTALEAAATRWSNVLAASNLTAASINDSNDGRIGFTHPGLGGSWQVSGALNAGSDALDSFGSADEYRVINWAADEWILYPGARALGSAGVGGTGTGLNFSSVYTDPNSHTNRNFGGFSVAAGSNNLPTWGGVISFNTGSSWNCNGDFYSIALHEIGHALGLSADWAPNTANITGSDYTGPMTLMAANMDNGTSVTSLPLVSSTNLHWLDNGSMQNNPVATQSFIFAPGSPDYSNTVGAGVLQDLLMEPTANFFNPPTRIELTNVDVASAKDMGWVVVPEPSSHPLFWCFAVMIFSAIRPRSN